VTEMPPPDGHEAKEVYAFYGLAAYFGQVFEKGMLNLLMTLHSEDTEMTLEHYDSIESSYNSNTLGQLLRHARERVGMSPNTDEVLNQALSKRNWLVHHYFVERAVAFHTENGRKDMIEELREIAELFHRADEAITSIYRPFHERRGITKESLKRDCEVMTEEFLASKA
jgi:hypothetical protein